MEKIKNKIIKYLKDFSLENVLSDLLKAQEKAQEREKESAIKDEFLSEFDKLNDSLKGKNENTKLDKLEYTPLSNAEIEKLAKSGVDKKYELKINNLEDALTKAINSITEDSKKVSQDSQVKKAEISKMYEEAGKNVEDNALKRGIARSSIVAEQIKDLDVEKIKDLLLVDDMMANSLKDNAQKISFLQDEYKNAVKNLNVEKVLEIDDNIRQLTKEQEDKIEEVLKYNNTIKKQQYDIDKNLKAPSEEEQNAIQNKMFEISLEYYMSLPKEQALKEFNEDKEVRQSLGKFANIIEKYLKARA